MAFSFSFEVTDLASFQKVGIILRIISWWISWQQPSCALYQYLDWRTWIGVHSLFCSFCTSDTESCSLFRSNWSFIGCAMQCLSQLWWLRLYVLLAVSMTCKLSFQWHVSVDVFTGCYTTNAPTPTFAWRLRGLTPLYLYIYIEIVEVCCMMELVSVARCTITASKRQFVVMLKCNKSHHARSHFWQNGGAQSLDDSNTLRCQMLCCIADTIMLYCDAW